MTDPVKKPDGEAPAEVHSPSIIAMQAAWHTLAEVASHVFDAYKALDEKDLKVAPEIPFNLGASIGMLSRTRSLLEKGILAEGGALPVVVADKKLQDDAKPKEAEPEELDADVEAMDAPAGT
jgi:hypothetical protein